MTVKFRQGFALILLCSAPLVCPAAGFSVSPSTVTNDYFGPVTLTIASLPGSGQSVRVEKFLDLNASGTVDAGDQLTQSFLVTDGVIPTLGGMTNLNVPGDSDGLANGQIVVLVNYPGLDSTFNRIEAPYLYRVSSPSNAFGALTQSFRVWQRIRAQSINGVIYTGTTATPLANALVIAYDSSFNAVTGAKANSLGQYTLFVTPGSYTVWPFLNSYVVNQTGGYATVSPGLPVTGLDIGMLAGANIVAGKLSDRVTGAGLPGVGIEAASSNLVGLTYTDTNGNYALSVPPGIWKLQYNADQMPLLGYLSETSGVTNSISSNVSNVNLSASKASALLFGSVRNNQVPSNMLANVVVSAADNRGQFQSSGMTYASNGLYSIGVAPGNWWMQPDSDSLSALGCVGAGTNWVIGSNQAARLDFVARRITAHLRGTTRDIFGIESGVGLQAVDPTHTWRVTATSDASGNFDLGVFGGTWQVSLDADTAFYWDAVGTNLWATVADGQTLPNLSYGFRFATAYAYGSVLSDQGQPLGGIGLFGSVTGLGGNFNFVSYTDNTGAFYAPVVNGSWTVGVECYGYDGLSFQGYECAAATSAMIGPGNNFLPTVTAYPLAAPVLSNPTMSGAGVYSFNIAGPTNRTFQVLAATNLTNWAAVFATNPVSGSFQFGATNSFTTPARSYRALVQ